MKTVTLSPKFQIIIPPDIRRALNLQPGQKIQLVPYDDKVVFIPLKPVAAMRGFLKGIDTSIEREPDR